VAGTDLDEPIVRPGPGQITVLNAPPGADVRVLVGSDAMITEGAVDFAGSLLFREVDPGPYTVELEDAGNITTTEVSVPGFDEPPPQDFYDAQVIDAGFGYLTVRDGTTLSVNVVLPGDAADGPFPTVVEYSAYTPSDPSGCSGGSFDYFEPIQATDGYDIIEAVAAQPWVAGNTVGMVGVSYSGISQLYVAATQPPSLEAITPLSVVDSSVLYTLYPGGILNDGFALGWALERDVETAPFGQGWTRTRVDEGDEVCRENQLVRLQNPGLEERIRANPFYSDAAENTDVRPLLDDIDVPVFLAGAWQDRVAVRGDRPTLARVPRSLRRQAGPVVGNAAVDRPGTRGNDLGDRRDHAA
jgi:uncharacterized protein